MVIGLAIGAMTQGSGENWLARSAGAFEVVGTLWINAIRMTVVPMVATLTLVAVATAGDAAKLGRLGGSAIAVFALLLLGGGFFALAVAPLSLDRMELAPEVAARLRVSLANPSGPAPAMPSLAQRLTDMVPVNPIRAAADGAILPMVIFTIALGFALTRLPAERREPVVAFCRAISEALLVLVGWVLRFAPVGVFALALALGAKLGGASAAVLVHYVATLSAVLLAATLLLYPVVAVLARVSPLRFAAAALPAQAVALSTRSSLAALPAMIAAARDTLQLGPRAGGCTIPLAAAIFRFNVPPAWVVGLIFLGKLYDVPLGFGTLAVLVVTATLISFSVPGVPSASLFLLAPVLVQHGLPAEGVGILIALDAIPDMFKTLANVTAHLTSAAVVARFNPDEVGPPA